MTTTTVPDLRGKVPNDSFKATYARAKATLARRIKQGVIEEPESCDGCFGRVRKLKVFIYDLRDATNFSAYCARCWDDHGMERMVERRKERFEAEGDEEGAGEGS